MRHVFYRLIGSLDPLAHRLDPNMRTRLARYICDSFDVHVTGARTVREARKLGYGTPPPDAGRRRGKERP